MNKNPILSKELRIGSRSFKMPLAWCIYNLILAGITLMTMMALQVSAASNGYEYSTLVLLFPVLASVQCGMITLIIPILTAASIAGERERQTLDVMLTTPVKPFAIVLGKLGTSITQVMMFVISSIPIMAIAFVFGGMNWFALLGFLAMIVFIAIYVGSIGIMCSSMTKKTITAVILSFVFIGAFTSVAGAIYGIATGAVSLVQYINYMLSGNYSYSSVTNFTSAFTPLLLVFTPYSAFVDFLLRVMGTSSLATIFANMGNAPWKVVTWIMYAWIPITVVVNLAISYLMLLAAAKNLNPLNAKEKRRGKKELKHAKKKGIVEDTKVGVVVEEEEIEMEQVSENEAVAKEETTSEEA